MWNLEDFTVKYKPVFGNLWNTLKTGKNMFDSNDAFQKKLSEICSEEKSLTFDEKTKDILVRSWEFFKKYYVPKESEEWEQLVKEVKYFPKNNKGTDYYSFECSLIVSIVCELERTEKKLKKSAMLG